MKIKEIMELDMEGLEVRKAEIRKEMDADGADIDSLAKEVDAIEERSTQIRETEKKKNEIRSKVAAGEIGNVVARGKDITGEKKMNEREVRAKALVETGKFETRAILSTGSIAKPGAADTEVHGLAAMENDIVDDVHAVPLTGTGSWTVGYQATNAEAADVVDGQAIAGTESTYSTVTINPQEIGVLDSVSNQVKKMTPVNYEMAVEDAAISALRTKMAEKIVTNVSASALAENIYSRALDQDYLRTCVLDFNAIKNKGGVALYINRADLIVLGAIRGTDKKALYEIAFDEGSTTSGTIKEGATAVRFRILEDLTAGVQLFGQPQTIDMPMWDGYEVKTDEGGNYFQTNTMGVRGLQTANANLVHYHGMQVIHQAAEE